jgi:hypothetical protein
MDGMKAKLWNDVSNFFLISLSQFLIFTIMAFFSFGAGIVGFLAIFGFKKIIIFFNVQNDIIINLLDMTGGIVVIILFCMFQFFSTKMLYKQLTVDTSNNKIKIDADENNKPR